MGVATALVASAVISAAGTAVAANQTKKALQGAQGIANRLTYEPVDIEKLKKDAADQAVANATASLELERSLQPDVAAARSNLSKSINEQLMMGGRVPPDVANQVARAARVAGGRSGGFGGTPGVTAATLGTTALNLLNQRQYNASNLLAANPLPAAGLDPGSLASLQVSQKAAQNDFNAAKAGVNMNLLNARGQARAAEIGGYANALSSIVGAFGGKAGGAAAVPSTAGTASAVGSPYLNATRSAYGDTGPASILKSYDTYNSSKIGGY